MSLRERINKKGVFVWRQMELKCLKMDLVEELLSIDDKDTLNRVKNYLKKAEQ